MPVALLADQVRRLAELPPLEVEHASAVLADMLPERIRLWASNQAKTPAEAEVHFRW